MTCGRVATVLLILQSLFAIPPRIRPFDYLPIFHTTKVPPRVIMTESLDLEKHVSTKYSEPETEESSLSVEFPEGGWQGWLTLLGV